MAEEKNRTEVEAAEEVVETKKGKKAEKNAPKKENFFVRVFKKFAKFCKNTFQELKKVTWLSKTDLRKQSLLVVVTVAVIAGAIALIDLGFSTVINGIAGLFG